MKKNEIVIHKTITYIVIALLIILTFLLLSELILSLQWRMEHDTPIYYYSAFLINKHHSVPYKDIFEPSIVGTFLFHSIICKLFGYGDFLFRLVDILFLIILFILTWFIMRSFDKITAWTSIVLFGLLYLGFGPMMSFQRDYIGIIPIAAAILLVTNNFIFKRKEIQALIIGALFGLSATIKPHLAIGIPAVIIYMLTNTNLEKKKHVSFWIQLLKLCLFAALGFLIIFSIPFIWLWQKGGLPYFWEMFSSYLKLHLFLTGNHVTISGAQRWRYLFLGYRDFGDMHGLLVPTFLGLYLALELFKENSKKIRLIYLLFTFLFLYSIYPVFAGQFWSYHWMPFYYFGCLCASLIMVPAASVSSPLHKRTIPLIAFMVLLLTTVHIPNNFIRQIQGQPQTPLKEGRVDEIANYLKEHLKPGDKVQPLDWTGGVLHGMLLSKAVIATPYIHDYQFYHHVSDPIIQKLRKRFIKRLREERPRFIIYMLATPRPTGEDTTKDFPELYQFLDENYSIAHLGNKFTIYEINNHY